MLNRRLNTFAIILLMLHTIGGPSPVSADVPIGKMIQVAPFQLPIMPTGNTINPLSANQIIIKYQNPSLANSSTEREPSGERQIIRLSQAAGVEMSYLRPMSGDSHVMRLPGQLPEIQVMTIAERLMALPEVAYARPDSILTPDLSPNDPYYSAGDQWNLLSPESGIYGINAAAAWDFTTGTNSVVIAVIDTGILLNHADLYGRTVPGYDFISDSWTANDGDGRDNDPSDPGDWVTSAEASASCPARNSSWHGSHVAGTIGASSNNSLGIAGINWNAKILPVRVLGKCGGYTSDIIDGIR